jgi:Secretion system C-terminal sorting domain
MPCNLRATLTQLGNRANAVVTNQGVRPYTYLWSNGATTPFITINSSGDYAVTVTDSIGCISTANATLSPGITNYRMDSTTVGCRDQQNSGCTPIILTRNITNVVGCTFRFRFDTTKVKPADILNHRLGSIIPAHDSVPLFQTISHDTVVLTLGLQGWRNIQGNIGDTLLCFGWLPAGSLLGANPMVAVTGTIEESVGTGGITTHPLNTTIRIVPSGAIFNWVAYQGDATISTTYHTLNNPTRISTGARGRMVYRGNVSTGGIFILVPWNGDSISIMRKSLLDIGLPQIGGNDLFRMSLVIAGHANSERNVSRLLAMDVNGDNVISAGDLTAVSRRAVNYQTGFEQANATKDTVSWRHFPKSYLVTRPAFKLSVNYPNPDGIGISRNHIPRIDTLFRPQQEITCDTLPLDVISILLGDCDGNFKDYMTDRKGKLSGVVTYDAWHKVAIGGDTFRIPVYANDLLQGFDCKIENYPASVQILAVSNAANTNNTANIDVANRKCFISGYATNATGIAANAPICYLTVKGNCLIDNYLGAVTSFVNGQTASSNVVICSTGTGDINLSNVQLYPNPTTGLIMVEHQGISLSNILIFNAIGRLIQRVEATAEQTQLNLNEYANGIYFVKVQDKVFKVVKE